MKCPVCWADKAYLRPMEGWKDRLLACLMLVPMQCHHCYHKYRLFWFQTLGKPVVPPLRIAPATRASRLSHAARQQPVQPQTLHPQTPSRRADAA